MKAESTMLNEQPDSASPNSAPAVMVKVAGVEDTVISTSPAAWTNSPMISTRVAPNLSATAPANGWPMPHIRFWIAMAKPNSNHRQLEKAHAGARAEGHHRDQTSRNDDDGRGNARGGC